MSCRTVARAFGWASLGMVGLAGEALRYGALSNALGISLVVLAWLPR